ncbi:MAG: DUF4165 domain-containing protein [Deltaproteobacteria bacterium]|nr:DUF4165 domain-containing protein [Deltaproteobacteria bacterium]
MIKRIFLTIMLLLVPVSVWADVIALSYEDPANELQTVKPTRQYVNATGPVSFYLNAGLDRRVGYIITDGSGQTVVEGMSDLIKPSDTITVYDLTYYGKVLVTPETIAEGSYTLTAQILDSAGSVVSTQSYPLVVDRSEPTAGEWWRLVSYNTKSFADNDRLFGTYIYSIWLKNVNDLSGVTEVQFESYDPDTGAVLTSKAGWYNDSTKEAGIGNGYNINLVRTNYLPSLDGLLGLRFILTDKAGNQGILTRIVKFDGHRNPLPELVAVHNPSVTTEFIPGSGLVGYEAYTPGMTVYENPMKFLYRLPRSNWTKENPDYGVYLWTTPIYQQGTKEPPVIYQDDTYVYFDVTLPYSPINFYRVWTLTKGSGYTIGLGFNIKLAENAIQSPKWLGMQYYRTDTGWTQEYAHGTQFLFNDTSTEITQMKVRVEPRPYDQIFDCGIAKCTIPAGETECIAPVKVNKPAAGTGWGGASVNHVFRSLDGSLYTWGGWTGVFYDLNFPQILSHDIDRINKKVTYVVNNYCEGGCHGFTRLTGYGLTATDTISGQEATINGVKTLLGSDNLQITVDYKSLPDGDWQFVIWAADRAGNRGSQDIGNVALDRTPPSVRFYRGEAAMADHDQTDSLDRISFTVEDNVDAAPQVEDVQLTGGPHGTDVHLAYREQDGAYVLEYPVLYPSAGQDYNLAVTVRDATGNRAVRTLAFSYSPPSVRLSSSGQEVLNLPALPAPVVHTDGSNALVSQPIMIQGSPLSGVYDLEIIANAQSTTPIVVNGVTLAPGEMTAISAYDFGANGGRLNLPLWSEQPGEAELVITSLAPNFPVLTAQVSFWQPEITLSADPDWRVQTLVQTQKIGAQAVGVPCQATLDEREAREADPIDSPKCLVEFTQTPLAYEVKNGVLQGVLGPNDPLTLNYQVSVFNNGQKYVLGEGRRDLGIKEITDVAIAATVDPEQPVYRKIQPVAVKLQSIGPIPCPLATSTERLRETDPAVCIVRWTQVPEGLQPAARTVGLEGAVANLGEHTAAWTVDVYHPLLGRINDVASGSTTLKSVTPPLPTISIEPGFHAEKIDDDTLVTTSIVDGNTGTLQFTSPAPSVSLSLDVSGMDEDMAGRQYQSRFNTRFSHLIRVGALDVWETRTVRARVYYTDMPEVGVEKEFTVLGAPSGRIRALLSAPREVLSTDGAVVRLTIGQSVAGSSEPDYDPTRDGNWKVRFGYLDRQNQFQPLTGYQALPADGVIDASVPDLPAGNQKLLAEAELVCPPEFSFYQRTLRSNPAYLVVLKGTEPEGRITGNRLSGPAPLTAVFSLRLASEDLQVLGDIQWQISDDQGASWRELATDKPRQAWVTVEAGTYLVRASITNRLSQAVGYTENVELTAYQVPVLEIAAPASVIVGTPVTFQARVTDGGQPVSDDNVVVEWCDRTGELVQSGPLLALNPEEPTTLLYRIRARFKDAPDADGRAWQEEAAYVRVLPPRPPSGRIVMPSYMEYNTVSPRTYHLTAEAWLPMGLSAEQYPIKGEWELPDGSRLQGFETDYAPRDGDANSRVVFKFHAWIEGFKEQTLATFIKSALVGCYSWSDFVINVKSNYPVAPALVTLTAEPTDINFWNLESPTYTWQLPEGTEIVRQSNDGRVVWVNFNKPGQYPVSMTVTDARGSTAQAAGTVVLAEPEPFEVSFSPLFSNPLNREPLDVLMRPRVTGGHPQDRLVDFVYSVNDPQAEVINLSGSSRIKGLTAGDRTIHLKAVSRLGKVVETDYNVQVTANVPPTCEISNWTSGGYLWYQAQCYDSDGRVIARRWYLDDRLISSGSSIRRGPGDLEGKLRFEAVDDAGGVYREALNYSSFAPSNAPPIQRCETWVN